MCREYLEMSRCGFMSLQGPAAEVVWMCNRKNISCRAAEIQRRTSAFLLPISSIAGNLFSHVRYDVFFFFFDVNSLSRRSKRKEKTLGDVHELSVGGECYANAQMITISSFY